MGIGSLDGCFANESVVILLKFQFFSKLSMTSNNSVNQSGSPQALGAKEIDVEFLPLLYDIIRTIEKEDASVRSEYSLEASQKILELNKKIETVREQVYKLPGIEYDKEEQLAQIQTLRKQLSMKKNLISKYKNTNLKVS